MSNNGRGTRLLMLKYDIYYYRMKRGWGIQKMKHLFGVNSI